MEWRIERLPLGVSDELRTLRERTWSQAAGQPAPGVVLEDEHDRSRHTLTWGVRVAARLVASARLSLVSTPLSLPDRQLFTSAALQQIDDLPRPLGWLSRLVVDPAHRSLGMGRALDSIRIEEARQLGLSTLAGVAGTRRVYQIATMVPLTELQRAATPPWWFREEDLGTLFWVDLRAGLKLR